MSRVAEFARSYSTWSIRRAGSPLVGDGPDQSSSICCSPSHLDLTEAQTSIDRDRDSQDTNPCASRTTLLSWSATSPLGVIGRLAIHSAVDDFFSHDRIAAHTSASQECGAIRTRASIAELSSMVDMDQKLNNAVPLSLKV